MQNFQRPRWNEPAVPRVCRETEDFQGRRAEEGSFRVASKGHRDRSPPSLDLDLQVADGAEDHLAVAQLHLTLEDRPNTEPLEQAAWHLRKGGPRVYKGVHLLPGGEPDSDVERAHRVSRRHGDGADRAGGLQVLYVVRISMGHSDADAPQDPRDLVLGHPR